MGHLGQGERIVKIHALWLTASVIALGWAGAASAQTSTNQDDKPKAAVQEVVVTAERRATNLQTTPIAASVLTGADLAKKGIITIDQLQFAMPSVAVDNFGQGLEFNIRGIGKGEHNSQTTTGVITYRDGVATFPGYFQEEPYFDIANVEVLRGPQGTFVGQNSTGGAVFVTSADPVINGGNHGYIAGQLGNYSDAAAQGAINLPISDTLAARFAFNTEYRDSFYHISGPWSGNPGRLKDVSLRLGLLWEPNTQTKVLFKTDYDYLDQGAYPADPVNSPNDLFHISANAHLLAIDQFVRSVLQVEYTFDNGIKFRSVSGFQKGRTAYDADLDGTSAGGETFFDGVDETIYSQEVNLISPDKGPFTWVVGAYYQNDKYSFPTGQFDITLSPGVRYDLNGTNPEHTEAVFGQAGYMITPSLQIQAGLRYTSASTTNHVFVDQYGLPLNDDQTAKSSDTTGKLALNWKIDPKNFVYAFVATGFKAGGLNVPVGLGIPAPFGPEKVTEYELGWKSTLLGGHVKTQLDAYYNDFKGFQVIIGYPAYPTFGFELNDPNTTKIYGVEASAQANFGALSIDGGLGLMHSSLGQFYAFDPRLAGYFAVAACDPKTGPANPATGCFDLGGKRQTYAPNFTFNVGAQYAFDLGHDDTVTPRLNYGHVSSQYATLFENDALGDHLGARNILGGQIAWTHGDLVATLYATNLTNEKYIGAVQSGLRFAGPPRQFGVRLLKVF